MKRKTKTIIKLTAITILGCGAIVLGGILEHGYYWPRLEVFILPVMAGYIGYRIFRKGKKDDD